MLVGRTYLNGPVCGTQYCAFEKTPCLDNDLSINSAPLFKINKDVFEQGEQGNKGNRGTREQGNKGTRDRGTRGTRGIWE